MESINEKILVFTDLHLGLKGASKNRLAICVQVIKTIVSYVKANNIKQCIFCGDWHHSRVSTENNVLNISYKLVKALAKELKIKFILGNHDIYMKNSLDINSLIMFKDLDNVEIINKPTYMYINGELSLLVPWTSDLSNIKKESVHFLFGHFETTRQYLIKSYIQEHSYDTSVSSNIVTKINKELNLESPGYVQEDPGNYVGDFVEIAKKEGVIFSGHIHLRKEFIAKGRNFVFVGSPYEQNLGETENTHGFYVINEDNSYEFHEITNVPKHITLKMSKIVENIDNFDFSVVKGNIVHKLYDVNVDRVLDSKIDQKITDQHPFEELTPDYDVIPSSSNELTVQNQQIELIKKSKLEYMHNYVANIDDEALKNENIDKNQLYNILKDYYDQIAD